MIDIETKINGLLSRNPDPREGLEGKADFRQLHFLNICPPMLGIVVDNHDPEGTIHGDSDCELSISFVFFFIDLLIKFIIINVRNVFKY